MLATRARHAALAGIGPYLLQGHCIGKTSLSVGAKPCCDVPATASKEQLAFAWRACTRATAPAVYREEAQPACLRRARVVPGW